MKKYIPNILSTVRMIFVPIFICLILYNKYMYSLIIFVVSSITDYIDGYLARRWNVVSTYGKIIDPIADKSLMISGLILITIYLDCRVIIPIILEITISITNCIYFKINNEIHTEYIGKCKTAFLMITISYIFLNYIFNFNKILQNIFISISIIFQILTLISYYIYQKKNKK